MSTKMHAARVSKDQFWEFAAEVRRVYLAEHPMVLLFRRMVDRGVVRSKCMDSLDPNDNYVELQLFDEGDSWLIRPLEVGWFFHSQLDAGVWKAFGVERVTYDNRTDVPPEDEGNEATADWVDEQIDAHRYLVFSVLARSDYSGILTSTWKT